MAAKKKRKRLPPAEKPVAAAERDVGGRPTKYDPEFHPKLAHKLALLGATDKQVADALEVCEATLNTWKKEHEAFAKQLNAGKLVADAEMAHSLYHRGLGYEHEAVKILQDKGEPVIVPYTERYPPDTAAASLWLRNRQPDKWRDKVDHEHAGKGGGAIPHQHSGEVTVVLSAEEAYLRMLGGK